MLTYALAAPAAAAPASAAATSRAQTDRQYATQNGRASAALLLPGLSRTLRKAEKSLVRGALAATPSAATTIARTRVGGGGGGATATIVATPRFLPRSETAHRITVIDSMVRELAIKHKNLNGMPLDLLGIQFKVRPRSIEAMLRRNADSHTLRIQGKRVRLSTQDTLNLIEQGRKPKR